MTEQTVASTDQTVPDPAPGGTEVPVEPDPSSAPVHEEEEDDEGNAI